MRDAEGAVWAKSETVSTEEKNFDQESVLSVGEMSRYGFSEVDRNIDTTITVVDSHCRLAKYCMGMINPHGRSYGIR